MALQIVSQGEAVVFSVPQLQHTLTLALPRSKSESRFNLKTRPSTLVILSCDQTGFDGPA